MPEFNGAYSINDLSKVKDGEILLTMIKYHR